MTATPRFRVVLVGGPRDGETMPVPGPGTRRLEVVASPTLLTDDPLAASLDDKAVYQVTGAYEITEDDEATYQAAAHYQPPPQ